MPQKPEFSWPQHQIRELCARARTVGEARATLADEEEARRFRFAIYYWRRRNDEGRGLRISVEKNEVIITAYQRPHINLEAAS